METYSIKVDVDKKGAELTLNIPGASENEKVQIYDLDELLRWFKLMAHDLGHFFVEVAETFMDEVHEAPLDENIMAWLFNLDLAHINWPPQQSEPL